MTIIGIPSAEYNERLERLETEVARAELDFYLVTSFDSIYYLTGAGFEPLERPFFLVVPRPGTGGPMLLVPRLDRDHMKAVGNIKDVRTYWDWPAPEGRRWIDVLFELIGKNRCIGVEPSLRADLQEELRSLSPVVLPLVDALRRVKSLAEIAMIRRASRYADRAVQELLDASYRGATAAEGFARTGAVTRSIIREVDRWEPLTTRVLMATWAAPRSARPHTIPALHDRLDVGPHVALALTRVNGYAAESERTYFTALPTPEMVRAFRAMTEARAIAFRMARPGVACAEIDAAVGEFLRAEGYQGEDHRLHRTGHGIGLGNHEAPWIASGSNDILVENMVISIEPGIYLDSETAGGYRHSDTVLITRDGSESLTRLPTDLRSMTLRSWRPRARIRGALVRRALSVGDEPTSPTRLVREGEGIRSETKPRDVGRRATRPRSWIKSGLAILAVAIFGLLAVLGFNTLATRSKQIKVDPVSPRAPLPGYAERLGRVIRFPTISRKPPEVTDPAPLVGLASFLEAEFPAVHREIEREVIGGHTLLYRWKGRTPSVEPILLMSHLDVVPVEEGTETKWTHPPFSGDIADGFVWGRGALDVKCGALGLLEAAERLLRDGFQPSGDVYFTLGHDEETGGREGNQRVAEMLRGRGVHFRFVLDEGGGLTEGIIDGIQAPVAFVGIAEKGMATVKLTGRGEGGHASMPPPQTVIGRVAAGVARLEANPFPARIEGATAAMLDYLGPEMPWPRRVALANRWLTGGLITRQFAAKPSLNALIRTTMAVTVAGGGEADNVLPETAETAVNLRLLPGDSSESAWRRVRDEVRSLGFEERLLTCTLDGARSEPSRTSSIDAAGFRTLQRTIAEIYPGVVVAPGLSMVATDSRHYAPIATDIYRFLPLRVTGKDLERIHGVDERIGVKTYAELIGFLARLIENLSAPTAQGEPGRPAVR